jgi:hypothetical protein
MRKTIPSLNLLPLILLLALCPRTCEADGKSTNMISLSTGFIWRGVTQRYNNYTPWRHGIVVNADIAPWDRESTHSFGLAFTFQNNFKGDPPQYAYRDKASNFLVTLGPSYLIRTPAHRLPANLRLILTPHLGFGFWRYTTFGSNMNNSSLALRAAFGIGAQFETGENMEWNIMFRPTSTLSEGFAFRSFELSAGFDFYF